MSPPRDATSTRVRILEAAADEFSAHGLAGARVDRIAAAAQANKRAIYEHFTDKERLFDAALHHVLGTMAAAVPITEDDLPDYAGRMFDYLVDRPAAVRMTQWRLLERPAAGPDDTTMYAAKVGAMGDGAGTIGPVDLLVLVCGLATAWFNTPAGLRAADGRDPHSPARLAAHRAAVVEAARRVVAR